MRVLILYYTKTGHTLEAVNAIAEGIRSGGSEADLVTVGDFQASMLMDHEGLILASPCWAGSITSSGVPKRILRVLEPLPAEALKGKRGGGISVYATKGGETTESSLSKLLTQKGCEDYRPGPVAKAGVPLSLWKGPAVAAQDEARFRAYGAEFVA